MHIGRLAAMTGNPLAGSLLENEHNKLCREDRFALGSNSLVINTFGSRQEQVDLADKAWPPLAGKGPPDSTGLH